MDDQPTKTFETTFETNSLLSDTTTLAPPDSSSKTENQPQALSTYDLSWENWRGTSASIYSSSDQSHTTPLYTIFCNLPQYWKFSVIKPDPDLSKAANKKNKADLSIGEIRFHWTNCRIDLTLHSQPLLISSLGLFTKKFTYTSPTLPDNPTITWKYSCAWKTWSLTCFDDKDRQLAKVVIRPFGYKKAGTIEVFFDEQEILSGGVGKDDVVQTGKLMDEIIVTGIAVAEFYYLLNSSLLGIVVAVA